MSASNPVPRPLVLSFCKEGYESQIAEIHNTMACYQTLWPVLGWEWCPALGFRSQNCSAKAVCKALASNDRAHPLFHAWLPVKNCEAVWAAFEHYITLALKLGCALMFLWVQHYPCASWQWVVSTFNKAAAATRKNRICFRSKITCRILLSLSQSIFSYRAGLKSMEMLPQALTTVGSNPVMALSVQLSQGTVAFI